MQSCHSNLCKFGSNMDSAYRSMTDLLMRVVDDEHSRVSLCLINSLISC